MTLVKFPQGGPHSSAAPQSVHRPIDAGSAALPRAPQTIEDTGLPQSFLVELVAKAMLQLGFTRLTDMVQHLCLSGAVLESVCQFMRREGIVEILRRGQHEADVHYDLTHGGRTRAAEWMVRSQYVGPAPVPLDAYVERVLAQSVTLQTLTATQVHAAFADLVVPDGLVDLLGTAMNSARPMLLYGPPGSGKTYLAERMSRLLGGPVAVPHAVLVHGEVVRVLDAHWHHTVPAGSANGGAGLDNRARPDARWVLCERPVVISGGELTLEMLDLSFDARAGYYEAPPHVKANNGIFIVDDLGRQVVRPAELMNRWIVPMERRHDYLMLRNGGKFQVPFDLVLVFSSNMKPSELADGAFLRRIGHKIQVGPLAEAHYRRVFEASCQNEGVPFDAGAYAALLDAYHRRENRPLMACYPRDLLHLISSRAAYQAVAPALTPELIDWAWRAYFATESS